MNDHSQTKECSLLLSDLTDWRFMNECLSKSEKSTLIWTGSDPILAMLLLLMIGYGIMGLRIEPLLLCSAAVAAGMARWQRVLLGRHH